MFPLVLGLPPAARYDSQVPVVTVATLATNKCSVSVISADNQWTLNSLPPWSISFQQTL